MHWRRFAIDTIPIDDPTKFELWLRERWAEKDELLEHYVSNGSFPEDVDQDDDFLPTVSESNRNNHLRNRITSKTGKDEANKEERWSGPIETEVKFSQWSDVVDIFTVVGYV
jgi:lysocardiolipin and lysophospholipid acyltransferase